MTCPTCGGNGDVSLINNLARTRVENNALRDLNDRLMQRQAEAIGVFAVARQYLTDAPPQDDEKTVALRRMIPDHVIELIDGWVREAVKTP